MANSELDVNSLLARLQQLLAGRRQYTWGGTVGLDRGMVHRLWQGRLPDPVRLIPLIRAEGVSISWLLTGKGTPFIVHAPMTDTIAGSLVQQLATEMSGPDAVIARNIEHASRAVVVLTETVEKTNPEGERYTYRHAEIIGGPNTGHRAAGAAANHAATVRQITLPDRDFNRLASGYMSLSELWRLSDSAPPGATEVPETSPDLQLTDREREVIEAFRAMDTTTQTTMAKLMQAGKL